MHSSVLVIQFQCIMHMQLAPTRFRGRGVGWGEAGWGWAVG